MAQAIQRMKEGCSLEENIERSFVDDKEKQLYIQACIYYNYSDFENTVDRLILLYEDYSKTDADLFSYASYSVIQKDISSSFFRKICEMHSNIKSEYTNDHLELLNKGIFSYIQNLKEENKIVPDCIMHTLNDLLDERIIEKINLYSNSESSKNYISSSLNYKNIKNKNIINCYYNKSSCGIGDFLRGSCYLFDLLNNKNASFNISLKHHDIGNYVKTIFDKENTVLFDVDKIYDTEKTNKILCSSSNYIQNMKNNLIQKINTSKNDDIYLFSSYCSFIDKSQNISNICITKECQKFMKDNLIYFDKVIEEGDNIIKSLDDFIVIHFRLGDFMMLKDKELNMNSGDINTKKYDVDFLKIRDTIKETQEATGKNVLILSDSNDLKKYIQEENFKNVHVTHDKSQHCSDNPGQLNNIVNDSKEKINNMFYVALDMYIMSKSNYIYSYSVYPWGSGFCFWISKIYNIPIESFMING